MMSRYKPVGWARDNYRHYLAAKYGSAGRKYGAQKDIGKKFLEQVKRQNEEEDAKRARSEVHEEPVMYAPEDYRRALFSESNRRERIRALGKAKADKIEEYISLLQGGSDGVGDAVDEFNAWSVIHEDPLKVVSANIPEIRDNELTPDMIKRYKKQSAFMSKKDGSWDEDFPIRYLIASDNELQAIARGQAPEVYEHVYGPKFAEDVPDRHRREALEELNRRRVEKQYAGEGRKDRERNPGYYAWMKK